MKKILTVSFVVLICAALGGVAWFISITHKDTVTDTSAPVEHATYTFDDAGVRFVYPASYVFESYPLGDESYSWTSLMLVRASDKASADANGASEGPIAILLNIFPNDTHQELEDWIRSSSYSNFNLSADKQLTETTIGGTKAYRYTHSGVFENDAIAVAHGDSIYLFEVSWADLGDSIRNDFQNLLKTVTFK